MDHIKLDQFLKGGVWRWLVGAAGQEAGLEQLPYLTIILVFQMLMFESGELDKSWIWSRRDFCYLVRPNPSFGFRSVVGVDHGRKLFPWPPAILRPRPHQLGALGWGARSKLRPPLFLSLQILGSDSILCDLFTCVWSFIVILLAEQICSKRLAIEVGECLVLSLVFVGNLQGICWA